MQANISPFAIYLVLSDRRAKSDRQSCRGGPNIQHSWDHPPAVSTGSDRSRMDSLLSAIQLSYILHKLFSAECRLNNILVAYSLALTVPNNRWFPSCLLGIPYPNVKQVALGIADGAAGEWRLVEWTNTPHHWSISWFSFAWFFMAYLVLVVGALPYDPSNSGFVDTLSPGNAWIWLCPVAVGWPSDRPHSH